MFNNKSILITGGTGSFGRQFIQTILERYSPRRVIVFSRDELKQHEMQQEPAFNHPAMRYFIGDIRDKDRLRQAFQEVDVVVHAAALKHVPTGEYNPFEVVKTNILGAQNIIDAAIEQGVKQVIALSTDKACNPVNFYGATKLCSDKLFTSAHVYVGFRPTKFSVVRYGNVSGSRGAVIHTFLKLRETGRLPITDERMTRFWITLPQAVDFVFSCLAHMEGGEIFVPKIPSIRITDLARAIGPDCEQYLIGVRPGEKLHEVMISEDDARQTLEFKDCYLIQPYFAQEMSFEYQKFGKSVPDGFRYSSDTNPHWLTVEELSEIVKSFERLVHVE